MQKGWRKNKERIKGKMKRRFEKEAKECTE